MESTTLSKTAIDAAYKANDAVPCKCCGEPLGKTSAAAHNGRLCATCDPQMARLFDTRQKHDSTVCATDRDAIMAIYAAGLNGNAPSGHITLPSGRVVEYDAAAK